MKKTILIFTSLVLLFTGCQKVRSGIEDIFNGNDKNVIAPLDFQEEIGADALEILNNCSSSIMNKNNKSNDNASGNCAIVINSMSQLEGVTDIEGNPIDCTMIDINFDKYSIIESCVYMDGTEYIANQRVRAENKGIKLYMELKNKTGNCYAWKHYNFYLFEKLPDASVEVAVWNSDLGGTIR